MRRNFVTILALSALMAAVSGCQPGFSLERSAPGALLPLTGENASHLGASALILEEQEGMDHFAIMPISAETGERIADAKPIELGGEIAYGFSRDRVQMAFLSNRTKGCEKYCLRVMDLRSWGEVGKPIPVEKGLSSWFLLPDSFDSDEATLPIIINKQTDTVSEVILVDRSAGAVTARVNLPASITKAALTAQGNVALYGLQTKRDGSGAAAYLALLSGADLSTLWEQESPEIVFYEGEPDHTDPVSVRSYDPAAVFAPGGGRLYVTAADRSVLLTVDFEQRSISSHKILPRVSWLEHLLGVTVAHAKTMNGVRKSGVLSPDGRYFFVVGQEYRAVKNDRGEYDVERIPLGLQVIDTQDGTLLREVNTDAHQVHLTPDSKMIILNGWRENKNGGQKWGKLMDASTWKVTQRLNGYARPSRLLDGSTALLVVQPGNGNSTELVLYRPGDPEPRIRVTHTRYIDWIVIP